MPRTKGAKNKNVNTAKNKNIININVNSSKSKRGRPRKTTANTNTQNRPPTSGGGISMAPPQVIISQPPADNSNNNSLLSSFLSSKMLNETMNLNRSNIEPTRTEQPSYFNTRESIIPRLPDTPIKQEVKPPTTNTGPPIPPPPPPPIMANKKEPQKELNLTGLSGREAMLAELKFAQSDEGKAEKARKKAEKVSKKEAQQSTAEFLNMSFTPPKRDIVEMMTPSKGPTSTALTPYKENKSFLDFVMGGTPQRPKTEQEMKHEKKVNRLKEIKKDISKPKQLFEYNDLKTELTGQPNPNNEIASGILSSAIKSRKARKELVDKKMNESIKQQKQREDAFELIKAASKRKLTKQYVDAKKDLKIKDTGAPLVVNPNTKQLILKKNRDRGIKAQKAGASKKSSSEQEKIIKFAKFMIDQNGVQPFQGLKQTEI